MALSKRQITQMLQMRENGLSQTEVSKKIGVSSQTVSYWEKKQGFTSGSLPTADKPKVLKAKKLVPVAFRCPHCDGPVEAL
jgi:DNA-binding XRE family transcriptional regulator